MGIYLRYLTSTLIFYHFHIFTIITGSYCGVVLRGFLFVTFCDSATELFLLKCSSCEVICLSLSVTHQLSWFLWCIHDVIFWIWNKKTFLISSVLLQTGLKSVTRSKYFMCSNPTRSLLLELLNCKNFLWFWFSFGMLEWWETQYGMYSLLCN